VTLREVNGRRSGFDTRVVNEDGVVIGEGSHEAHHGAALIEISRCAAARS
jgi:hypothetical protein